MKKYSVILALGMILLAAAHSLITEESVMHSLIFALSPLAFLRIVYYLKKFSGDGPETDELVRFYEHKRLKSFSPVISPLVFGLLAYEFISSYLLAAAMIIIGAAIEIIIKFIKNTA